MKKQYKKKRIANNSILPLMVIALALAVTFIIQLLPGRVPRHYVEQKARKDFIVWKDFQLPKPVVASIPEAILQELSATFAYLEKEASTDQTLMRLISEYRATALTSDKFEAGLQKLRGLNLDFIGQLHFSLNTDEELVGPVQSTIAQKVRSNYDVLWTEDMTGGEIVTAENAWRELVKEEAQSDILSAKNISFGEKEAKAQVEQMIPISAVFQLLYKPGFRGEVRAADYRPLKAIQQRLMAYELPNHVLGFSPPIRWDQAKTLMHALSMGRDLYILHTIAEKADRRKRNVLVLGSFHYVNVSHIMANYGVACKSFSFAHDTREATTASEPSNGKDK